MVISCAVADIIVSIAADEASAGLTESHTDSISGWSGIRVYDKMTDEEETK
jgi:hypothetical protein